MNNIINNKINNAILNKTFQMFSLITHFNLYPILRIFLIFREALVFNLLLSSLTNTSTLLLVTT